MAEYPLFRHRQRDGDGPVVLLMGGYIKIRVHDRLVRAAVMGARIFRLRDIVPSQVPTGTEADSAA